MNWKVTWNPKLYNYEKLIEDYINGNHNGYIKQSKGMAIMKTVPQIGDIVYVSCEKRKIMRCNVVSEFITNDDEKQDPYNIGEIRKHSQNNTHLEMMIVEIYREPETLLGSQRTWIQYNLE